MKQITKIFSFLAVVTLLSPSCPVVAADFPSPSGPQTNQHVGAHAGSELSEERLDLSESFPHQHVLGRRGTKGRNHPGVTLYADLELGPDGCLYLIEFGSAWGNNRDSQIVRIEYTGPTS